MNITQKRSPNYTKGRSGNSIDRIVVHWIVGTLEAADATFLNDDSEVSAHYGIGDSDVHQYVSENDTAWHAGNWDMNTRSIGIEHEGGPDLPISEETYKTSAKLIRTICDKYSIPIDRRHIIGHREVKATQCPGTLDIDKLIEMAKSSMNEYEKQLEQLQDELIEMRASRNDWKRKHSELEDKYENNMKEKNDHIEALQKTVSELNLHNTSLSKDKDILIEDKNALEEKLKVADELRIRHEERITTLEEEKVALTNSCGLLEAEIVALKKKVKQKLEKYSIRELLWAILKRN